jgi:N-acyl homoserine lactone hydrolase
MSNFDARLRCIFALLLFGAVCVATGCAPMDAQKNTGVQRLYVLYCGEAQIPDLSPWSPGFNIGKPGTFSDNCYLIQHGKDWMLWDSGFPDALAATPEGIVTPRMRAIRTRTLASQLAEIGVAPNQITYLAFSHTHGDHVGNGNLFTAATLYIQQAEYDAAFGPEPGKYGFVPATYDKLRNSPTVKLQGDFDIFGDGSVKILSTPGHTPGHQSLLVRLPKTGAVVLSGDVAHFEENFVNRRVPGFNFNIEQSRQSMDKIDAIVKAEHAQLWINHDAKQSATIPHAPQFIE